VAALQEGDADTNVRSEEKECRYLKRKPGTIPPLVVDGSIIKDGNHRFRVAKLQGLAAIWCYVVTDVSAPAFADFQL
jgi:hypothetical protein